MPIAVIVCGVLLILLGIAGYSVSDAKNPVTALIPAGWGILLLIPGLVAQMKPGLRKHAMHAAAGLALLGLLLAGGRLAMVLADDKPDSTLGVSSLAGMALICGVLLVLCVRSFVAARRARTS
jgi:peptidoglycan/LPS O-acetylase OafA/YrhL